MNATIPHPTAPTYLGSYELFCREIGKTPLLTKEEERELAIRNQRGEPAAREQLINANLRLVVSVARKFCGMGGNKFIELIVRNVRVRLRRKQ